MSLRYVLLVGVLVLLTSCTAPTAPTSVASPTNEANDAAGYPAPQSEANDAAGYPAPTTEVEVDDVTGYPGPTSEAGESEAAQQPAPTEQVMTTETTGAITGVLLDTEGQPISGLGVFLADLTDGPEPGTNIITYQLASSKRGSTDDRGRFVINDVEPNSYSLAVWTPSYSGLIPEPGSAEGSAILLEVEAGEVTDVGTLEIERPQ
jgi:hypothetical protein